MGSYPHLERRQRHLRLTHRWGRRRFAYEIDHKTEGYYVVWELTADGAEYGPSRSGPSSGMSAEHCAQQVVDGLLRRDYELVIGIETALQALKIKDKDPAAFVQRMAGMLKWLEKS